MQPNENVQLAQNASCNVTSYDCSQITCSLSFSNEVIKLSVNISQWQKPMTANVTLSVPKPEYDDWSATFTDGKKIEFNGFPLKIEGSAVGDVHLQCSLKKENCTINYKV